MGWIAGTGDEKRGDEFPRPCSAKSKARQTPWRFSISTGSLRRRRQAVNGLPMPKPYYLSCIAGS